MNILKNHLIKFALVTIILAVSGCEVNIGSKKEKLSDIINGLTADSISDNLLDYVEKNHNNDKFMHNDLIRNGFSHFINKNKCKIYFIDVNSKIAKKLPVFKIHEEFHMYVQLCPDDKFDDGTGSYDNWGSGSGIGNYVDYSE